MLKKPYVIIFSTMTIDGRIASPTGYSKLSCPYDLKRLHSLRAEVDAVMVGANTVIKDNPRLTVRLVKGKNPIRVIVDGKLRTPMNARVYDVSEAKTMLITSTRAEKEKINALREKGVEIIVLEDQGEGKISLTKALTSLYDLGVRKILVEGGGKLNWSLIRENLVNEIRVTIAPYIFGNGVSFFQGKGYRDARESPKLKLINVFKCECGNEIHVIYKVMSHANVNSTHRLL